MPEVTPKCRVPDIKFSVDGNARYFGSPGVEGGAEADLARPRSTSPQRHRPDARFPEARRRSAAAAVWPKAGGYGIVQMKAKASMQKLRAV
jgi:hypothetical protein